MIEGCGRQTDQADPSNAAPEWQARSVERKQGASGGMTTRGAC